MQISVMFVFAAVWLLIFWFGTLAFEATGMERRKARFQALSAITGTGFTTGESESVVNHPRRRRIASWLILLGNTGVVMFLVVLLLAVRSGLREPSVPFIVAVASIIVIITLGSWLGITGRISNIIVRLIRRSPVQLWHTDGEILHQTGNYAIVRSTVTSEGAGMNIGDTGLTGRGRMILAIERKGTVLAFPSAEEPLLAGDNLLYYGELKDVN